MLRTDRRIPVDDVAPAGVGTLGARIVADPALVDPGAVAVFCCFPGGGMSSRYFELGEPGGPYDMATHLAAAGFVMVMIDHPGVGRSDLPDDGWSLTPEVITDVDAAAATKVLDGLRAGTLVAGLPALPGLTAVGMGHSMGGMFVALQQGRHRTYDAVALLGYSGRGLPEVLLPDELAVAGDPDRIRSSIVALARARFGEPFPRGGTSDSEMLVGPGFPDGARAAIAVAASALLPTGGLFSMLPGSHAAELAAIDVPVFLGQAEHDITGPPDETPRWLTGSPAVTLHVLPGAFHNANVAANRTALWDRVAAWARGLTNG
jgi:alpha-beta hydrolase superfamily lysophospholipase